MKHVATHLWKTLENSDVALAVPQPRSRSNMLPGVVFGTCFSSSHRSQTFEARALGVASVLSRLRQLAECGVRSHPVLIMEVGLNDVDGIQDGHHILKYGAAL